MQLSSAPSQPAGDVHSRRVGVVSGISAARRHGTEDPLSLWERHLADHDARRARLLAAAGALLEGDARPAAEHLRSWRFAGDETLQGAVLTELVRGGFQPTSDQLAVAVGDADALRRPPDSWWGLPPIERRGGIAASRGWEGPASAEAIIAWAMDELALLGDEIERTQRRAWREIVYAPSPKDAEMLALWREWFANKAWNVRERWEKLFLPVAARAFGAVLEARQFPDPVRRQIQEDLQESFFFTLLGSSEGPPGWQELAVRVLETGAQGPNDALAACLDERSWRRVAICAVQRGYGPRTAQAVWPRLPNATSRARALARMGEEDPTSLERFLDAHVALRVIDTWRETGDCSADRSWRVILQNRGRASGRLRAVLANSDPERLLPRVLGLSGLYSRTVAAVSRHCRDWAWQQLSRGFSFDYGRAVGAPCLQEGDEQPLGDEALSALRCWVLLVILRDRLSHLRLWVAEGTTRDRDTQWGRLLKDAVPEALRDSGVSLQRSRYHLLRAELAENLDSLLGELLPVVEKVAALRELSGGQVQASFHRLLEPMWVSGVPFPQVRYGGYIENARKALSLMTDREMETGHAC